MTLHYHGTPISPITALYELRGRCFCVSHADTRDVRRAHEIGQSVMLDNGAYSCWRANLPTDWPSYHTWVDQWLDYPTTWAVIPDQIDGAVEVQDALIAAWPFGERGAPVWHMNEPLERLIKLTHEWPKVCIGSTAQYAKVLSEPWSRRIDQAFASIAQHHRRWPWIHMLRGMSCAGLPWPFASLDSSDIAQNHHLERNTPRKMADRWDAMQCSSAWRAPEEQEDLFATREAAE